MLREVLHSFFCSGANYGRDVGADDMSGMPFKRACEPPWDIGRRLSICPGCKGEQNGCGVINISFPPASTVALLQHQVFSLLSVNPSRRYVQDFSSFFPPMLHSSHLIR